MNDFRPINWYFSGRVLPSLPLVSIAIPLRQAVSHLGFSYELQGTIYHSIVTASVLQLDAVDMPSLRNSIALDIQSSVDLASFFVGAGMTVELVTARSDSGDWHVFDAFIPALKRDGQVPIPLEVVDVVAHDIPAQMALADFREAMRVPIQTGFFCYRAVEAIMQSIRIPGQSDPRAWEEMRTALRVERSAIDRIQRHASWARHGRTGVVTDADRVMLFRSTSKIIRRYIDYVLGGRRPFAADVSLLVAD